MYFFSPVDFGKTELSGVVYAQDADKYNKEAEREKAKLDNFLKYDANTGEITFNIEIDYDKVRITNDGGVRAGEFIKSNSGFEGIKGVEYNNNNKWIITRDYYGNSKKVKVEVLKKEDGFERRIYEQEIKILTEKDREEQARREKEEQARRDREEQARRDREEQARREKEEQARRDREEQARRDREEQARKDREEQARKDKEEQARRDKEEQARREKEEKPKEVPAMPLTPGTKVIPSTPLQPSIKVAPRAFRNDNDQRGSIDWRYIKAPSKDAKTEVQKQKTVVEVKVTIGSDILQRTINNHTQEIKMDTKAIIKDGRTMLPIRYVAEALGYTVEWREDTRTAILKDKETTIEIPVDTNKIIINGKEIQSDVKPMIENRRTMLPIANVARALG
ncbi:copper amine oxidase domain protein, partial [Peptoniphilus indolicus ATCC 29427]